MVDDVIVAVVPIGDFSKKNYNELWRENKNVTENCDASLRM